MDNIVRDWERYKPQQLAVATGVTSPNETTTAINDKLEAMALECERMPFGDTATSFAAWIREHKV